MPAFNVPKIAKYFPFKYSYNTDFAFPNFISLFIY